MQMNKKEKKKKEKKKEKEKEEERKKRKTKGRKRRRREKKKKIGRRRRTSRRRRIRDAEPRRCRADGTMSQREGVVRQKCVNRHVLGLNTPQDRGEETKRGLSMKDG